MLAEIFWYIKISLIVYLYCSGECEILLFPCLSIQSLSIWNRKLRCP